MPVTVAVAAAAVAIGRGGSRLALLKQVMIALRYVCGEMLQLSSCSAVFLHNARVRRGSCALT